MSKISKRIISLKKNIVKDDLFDLFSRFKFLTFILKLFKEIRVVYARI